MFGKLVVIVVLVTLVKNASLRVVEAEPKLPNSSTQQDVLTLVNNWLLNDWELQNEMTLQNESTLHNELTLQNETIKLDEAGDPIIIDRNSEAPEAPQRKVIEYLNCSELHERSLGKDFIQLSDSIIVKASNPCIMKASVIILKNNEFPGYQHAYNITGKKIVMIDNEFSGPEQNHYIVGDNVLLANNTYQGHLQVHEVAGYDVTAFQNVFDGEYRVHQYAATIILVFDNESKGNRFDVILTENPPNLTYGLYPNVLSHYETGAINVRPQTEYSLRKTSPATFDITPMDSTSFLEEVKLGSKISRPADAPVVTKLQELIDDIHDDNIYDDNIYDDN